MPNRLVLPELPLFADTPVAPDPSDPSPKLQAMTREVEDFYGWNTGWYQSQRAQRLAYLDAKVNEVGPMLPSHLSGMGSDWGYVWGKRLGQEDADRWQAAKQTAAREKEYERQRQAVKRAGVRGLAEYLMKKDGHEPFALGVNGRIVGVGRVDVDELTQLLTDLGYP